MSQEPSRASTATPPEKPGRNSSSHKCGLCSAHIWLALPLFRVKFSCKSRGGKNSFVGYSNTNTTSKDCFTGVTSLLMIAALFRNWADNPSPYSAQVRSFAHHNPLPPTLSLGCKRKSMKPRRCLDHNSPTIVSLLGLWSLQSVYKPKMVCYVCLTLCLSRSDEKVISIVW